MNVKVKFWLDVAVLPRPQPHLAGLQGQAMVEAELQRPLRHVLPGCHPGLTKTDAGEIKRNVTCIFLDWLGELMHLQTSNYFVIRL